MARDIGVRGHRCGEPGRSAHPLRVRRNSGSPQALLNNASPELCANYPVPGQTTSIDVYCTMVWQPYSSNTRVFTYSACLSNTAADNSPADCAAQPLVQARYAFYDYASAGATISARPQNVSLLQRRCLW